MTVTSIARHAAERPSAIAVINNGITITYADLEHSVGQFSRALEGIGLMPGEVAAIECRDPYLSLLFHLACEGIGAGTFTISGSDLSGDVMPFGHIDLVLAERAAEIRGARRIIAIDRAWVERALSAQVSSENRSPEAAAASFRLLRTSGTSGVPKFARLRAEAHERRIVAWQEFDALKPDHRYLVSAPFTLNSVYVDTLATLRAGATLVFDSRISLAEALILHAITHVKLMPLRLRDTVDKLPADYVKCDALTIKTVGGPVPGELRSRAEAHLAGRVRNFYGSNETGSISVADKDDPVGVSSVLPSVVLDIVDDSGRPIPHGATGRVRVRTPYMADAYLDAPVSSAAMFRDGWFYPGDLGILHGPGRLEIIGRADDILNIGGLKVLPEDIEQTVRERVSVSDVGACAVPNAEGIDEIWIAVVYDAPDDRDIRARLGPAFAGFRYGHAHLVKLGAIPRTGTGKIKRTELKEAVLAAAGARRK